MKKKVFKNYRIEISILEPDRIRKYNYKTRQFEDDTDHQGYLAAGEELIKNIRRHCDFDGSIDVNFDTKEVCEFCGWEWETSPDESPACCQEAVNEWEKNRGIKS
jgi:hypothetical protein